MREKVAYKFVSLGVIAGVILLILCAWSPWVGESYAQKKAKEAFIIAWENTSDGCGFDCEDCGIKGTKKVLFGRDVRIDIVCGWEGDVIDYRSQDIFISFIGNTKYEKHINLD